MEWNVSAALKQPGTPYQAELLEAFPPQVFSGREVRFAEPVFVGFTYSFDGKALNLTGQLRAAWHEHCAGCDEPFVKTLQIPFEERFVKGTAADEAQSEADDGIYRFEGESIKLSTMVLDNIFLHMPIRSLCRENCKGLCPVCGCNRNTTQCTCVREGEHKQASPFAALDQLLNDDKEV
ncbi:DUF177 domain-containing protein [Christensenellaceae bacterium OttesenSCG-928-L17]|nr:DUF177 domain-containing protein [Christensenellaceae bacterium OttesenSCG-928-L17]